MQKFLLNWSHPVVIIAIGLLSTNCNSNMQQMRGKGALYNKNGADNMAAKEMITPPENKESNDEVTRLAPFSDPGVNGPMDFDSYQTGLESDSWLSAEVYYPIPTDERPGPYPATTMSGGYTNVKEDMTWMAERMASHGFVVIVFTPTNNRSLNPVIWQTGHEAGIEMLLSENQNDQSPIVDSVNTEKLGITGFSMGGAGTILAANNLGDKIAAAMPLNAFSPAPLTTTTPALFVTGTLDRVAVPGRVEAVYDQLENTEKALANFSDFGHSITRPGDFESDISSYTVSWYQIHLAGHPGYLPWFTGDEVAQDQEAGIFESGRFEYIDVQ